MPLPAPRMAPLVRLRAVAAALALAAALATVLLAPGTAVAATRPRVTFTGGTPGGLLGCAVAATPASLRVPAETTITVVNRLHQRAELLVNDADYGVVPDGNQVGVTVHRGPVRLTLVPACQLTGHGAVVTVEVTGAPAGVPATASVPAASAATVPGDEPDDSGTVEVTTAAPVPPPGHASGLLELVAGTFIVGVSIMAIRGKTAQRPASMRSVRQMDLARRAGYP